MNEDRIVAGITAIIGLAAMVFGMSQDTVSTLQQSIPQIVGGAMAIASVVTYLVNRQKTKQREFDQRSQVFSAMAYQNAPVDDKGSVRSPDEVKRLDGHIAKAAKAAFGIDIATE